jgi:hypothetical protein
MLLLKLVVQHAHQLLPPQSPKPAVLLLQPELLLKLLLLRLR